MLCFDTGNKRENLPAEVPLTSMHSRTASRAITARVALGAMLLGVLFAAFASPAHAKNRKVRAIRAALIEIEDSIDAAKEEIRTLGVEARAARAAVGPAHEAITLSVREPMGGLLLTSDFLSDLADLESARAAIESERVETPLLRKRIWELIAERTKRIDRLEVIVRREQAKRRDIPYPEFTGSLITYSGDWEATAQCESSGRWHINTGLFDGGLQFLPSTWIGFGGGEFARYAYQATKKQQIAIAERVLAIQGQKAWPNCFKSLPFHF